MMARAERGRGRGEGVQQTTASGDNPVFSQKDCPGAHTIINQCGWLERVRAWEIRRSGSSPRVAQFSGRAACRSLAGAMTACRGRY